MFKDRDRIPRSQVTELRPGGVCEYAQIYYFVKINLVSNGFNSCYFYRYDTMHSVMAMDIDHKQLRKMIVFSLPERISSGQITWIDGLGSIKGHFTNF